MRHLALIGMPLRVVLGIAATSVLLFYRSDRRTHEANLARIARDFPDGYPRPGMPRGRIDDPKPIATA
jgi:hypothetical protein